MNNNRTTLQAMQQTVFTDNSKLLFLGAVKNPCIFYKPVELYTIKGIISHTHYGPKNRRYSAIQEHRSWTLIFTDTWSRNFQFHILIITALNLHIYTYGCRKKCYCGVGYKYQLELYLNVTNILLSIMIQIMI